MTKCSVVAWERVSTRLQDIWVHAIKNDDITANIERIIAMDSVIYINPGFLLQGFLPLLKLYVLTKIVEAK